VGGITNVDGTTIAGDGSIDHPLRVISGSDTIAADGVTIKGNGSGANPIAIKQVEHDTSLAGAGTVASPLAANVQTDGSLTGAGTSGSPLAVNPAGSELAVVWNTNQAAGNIQQNNAGGAACSATGGTAVALGNGSTASGSAAVAIGDGCTASGGDSLALGNGAQATNTNARAIGNNAQATAANTTAIGDGSIASAADAVAIGNGAQATAASAVAMGNGARALGSSSVAIGDGAEATAPASDAVALGDGFVTAPSAFAANSGTANGSNSAALGKGTATGNFSTALGDQSNALREGQRALAAGRFAALGDAQTSELVLRGSTPGLAMGESVELMFGDAGNQQFTVPANSFRSFIAVYEVIATGISAGGSGPINLASFKQTLVFHENGGGVLTQDVSGTQEKLTSAGAASWTFAASVPIGPGRLALTFTTGTTTLKTRVVATLRFTELVPPT